MDACPETWDPSGVCVSCKELDENLPFWNPMTKRCVAACPSELEPTDGSSSCSKCDAEQYFDPAENKCVSKCHETWNANRVCESCKDATNGA